LYFSIPAITLVLFVVSLYKYLSAKKANKKSPGTINDEALKRRKTMLIVTSVIFAALVAVIIGFISLLFLAVAFM
jgi:hypothetical protein